MDSSNFQPPIRRSLSDEELEARVNQAMTSHTGVEAVMELLVAQEALRAQEDQEETNWIATMEADGSPEALSALQGFLGSKNGFVPNPDAEVQETITAEPVVENKPEQIVKPQTYSWLNPAPPTPVVEEVVEQPAEVQPAEETSFSWFTEPEVADAQAPDVVEPVAEVEPESIALVVEESTEVVLEPVGSESVTEFEMLLAAAAAEEELTALEELEVRAKNVDAPLESNVLIPSDEHRNRGPLSQLWVWLGLSATIVPILLVWALVGFGLSASAIALVLVIGYVASGTVISVAAIAGKRSGLSTSTISRAAFGVWGNSIPLAVTLVSRIVVTAIIIASFTFFANGVAAGLPNFNDSLASIGGINFTVGLVIQSLILLVITLLVLVRGDVARVIQVVMSLVAFALVAETFLVVASGEFSFASAGSKEITSTEAVTGVALILLVNLTLWFALAPNISKAIPMRVRGLKVFTAVLVANFLLPVVVGVLAIFWLGTLSSSGALGTIQEATAVLPGWAQGALTSGSAIAIVYASMLSLRTATLDFVSLFRLKTRIPALVAIALSTLAFLVLFAQQSSSQQAEYLVNLFILCAALSAGWIGIFFADVSIRKQAYHELSLSRAYGLYGKFNVLSLLVWVVTLVSAVALIPVNLMGFGFMGFQGGLIAGGATGIAVAALGFVVTVLLGMLLTYAIRIPQIRKQEREVLALESRREQLNDIFVGTE